FLNPLVLMDLDDDPYESFLRNPNDLHRIKNVPDMSKLIARREQSSRSSQRSTRASIGSGENGAEDSQVLFMKKTTGKKRKGRSFSEISHNSAIRLDEPSDGKDDVESDGEAAAMEELVANIIDREIHEWQFVCETGRPYWWSPEQKFLRMRKHSPGNPNKYDYRKCMEENDCSPKQAAGFQRRAVSEGYLSDSSSAHSLAQMIAVQLLSSCFTLPPDCVLGPPSYPTSDKIPGVIVLDPRMISCSQHLARNAVANSLDGQSGTTSIPASPEGSGFQTPEIGTSEVKRRRRLARRRLHVTERSSMESSVEGDSGDHVRSSSEVLDPTVASTASQRRKSTPEQSRLLKPIMVRKFINSQGQIIVCNRLYAQNPITFFIQPVRELVVKRWRTLRRRFGGSLHAPLTDGRSEDKVSTGSESGASEVPGLANSNDGKARRQRARERGNIHSSSVDSEGHCNSPATPCPTPEERGARRPRRADSVEASPPFALADPLSATAALAAAEPDRKEANSGEKLNASAPSPSSIPASSAQPPTGTLAWSPPTSTRNRSFAPRASHLRRSRLSEVHTPEDCLTADALAEVDREAVDRGILSAAGSALASPGGDPPSPLARIRGPINHFEVEDLLRAKSPGRMRLRRTSTSGTQVFHPDEDGVEIDGLPVGPGREIWSKKGGSRETTYL
ncbi:hypothetical protein LSUB1_G002209, partial [Lachnellula subtilissima]